MQGAVGYGLALMVVPVLALVRPEALPAVVLLLAMPTAGFKVVREWRFADACGLVWILSGCLAGALGGVGPLALVYQDHSGPEIRSTLAVAFLVGTEISLATLFFVGRLEWEHLLLALQLLAGLLLGLLGTR